MGLVWPEYFSLNRTSYSNSRVEEQFMDKEEKVTKFILCDFEGRGKLNFIRKVLGDDSIRSALYDSILMKLTNKNYRLCSNLSKRLDIPKDNFFKGFEELNLDNF
jgi:hypothetical protein